jgi:hypothetical protein
MPNIRLAVKRFLAEERTKPFMDCSRTDPTAIRFVRPMGSDSTVDNLKHITSLEKMRDEIAKRDRICAGCLAKRLRVSNKRVSRRKRLIANLIADAEKFHEDFDKRDAIAAFEGGRELAKDAPAAKWLAQLRAGTAEWYNPDARE